MRRGRATRAHQVVLHMCHKVDPQGHVEWCCMGATKQTHEGTSDGVMSVPKRPMRVHWIVFHAHHEANP